VTSRSAILVFLDFIAPYSDSMIDLIAHVVTGWVFIPITAALQDTTFVESKVLTAGIKYNRYRFLRGF
jgi:hypothetical protein